MVKVNFFLFCGLRRSWTYCPRVDIELKTGGRGSIRRRASIGNNTVCYFYKTNSSYIRCHVVCTDIQEKLERNIVSVEGTIEKTFYKLDKFIFPPHFFQTADKLFQNININFLFYTISIFCCCSFNIYSS